VEHYNAMPVLKTWDDGFRPLRDNVSGRRKKHMSVRQGADGEIIYRLYSTDMVTYHKDGRLSLELYSSKSSQSFQAQLSPWGVRFSYSDYEYVVWTRTEKYVLSAGVWLWEPTLMQGHMLRGFTCTLTMVSDGVWVVDPKDTTPIHDPRVDAARARVALVKYDYGGFENFIRAKAAMQEEETVYAPTSEHKLRHLLPMGVEGWVQVKLMSKSERAVNELLSDARLAIYKLENVVTSTELPHITSDTQWKQIRRRRSVYGSVA
jgi:hypothetical protein